MAEVNMAFVQHEIYSYVGKIITFLYYTMLPVIFRMKLIIFACFVSIKIGYSSAIRRRSSYQRCSVTNISWNDKAWMASTMARTFNWAQSISQNGGKSSTYGNVPVITDFMLFCFLQLTQTELVLCIFRRLAEDVVALQTVPSQRRREILSTLTREMAQIYSFFLGQLSTGYNNYQQTKANVRLQMMQLGNSFRF